MTQKEKLEQAKRLYKDANADQRYVLEQLFPELAESRDERIRKEIIKIFNVESFEGYNVDNAEAIEWLEKQKPVEWSEEDEKMLDSIMVEVSYIGEFPDYPTKEESELYDECLAKVKWLKSLKERVQPQDTWKPSEKQMNALDSTLQYSKVSSNSYEHLNSLFNDLKKLREE